MKAVSTVVLLFFLLNATFCFGLNTQTSQSSILSGGFGSNKYAYNVSEAHLNLYLSYSSYCDLPIKNWNCSYCTTNYTKNFNFVTYFTSVNLTTFGYVGYMDNAIFVVFRGTQGIPDLILDLDFAHFTPCSDPLPPVPNCYVHKGFHDSYASVRSQVVAAINLALQKCPTCNVLKITGHSLGGALAVLCAVDMANTQTLPIQIYNFGQPRVGNDVFVDFYTSLLNIDTTWRVVNQRDMVPHLPTMFMGFRHEPTEVWYYELSTYKICSSATGEDPTCSDSFGFDLSIYDHLHYFGIYLDDIIC
eukprot:TRINITY_DN8553_c0_g1_i1.p1 TRINITY_DN8553_c0_g1~~TRINITY_DN8553_c0_g1_i1.p1  ORF type:complete len:303 (-),score=24.05 TRINITY_DN8553_c0_g1_i1:94-1002(-)